MFNKKIAELVFSQSEDKSKSWKERKQHTIDELKEITDEDIKIVCLADKLSNIRSISRDYAVLGEKLWERFNAGKDMQAWYYKGLAHSLASLETYPAYREFKELVGKVFDF
jgi:(p)ppGpp synthase/HD superfamily hydrolase